MKIQWEYPTYRQRGAKARIMKVMEQREKGIRWLNLSINRYVGYITGSYIIEIHKYNIHKPIKFNKWETT